MAAETRHHFSATAHQNGAKAFTWGGQAASAAEAKANLDALLRTHWAEIAAGRPLPALEVQVKKGNGIDNLCAAKAYPLIWHLAGVPEQNEGPGQAREDTVAALDSILASDPGLRFDLCVEAGFLPKDGQDMIFAIYGPGAGGARVTALTRRAAMAVAWRCGVRHGELPVPQRPASATLDAARASVALRVGAAIADAGAARLEAIGLPDLAKAIRRQAKAAHGGRHAA